MRALRGARLGLGAGLLLLALASGAHAVAEPAPACLASARSVPAEGYAGQQLLWQLEILRRADVTQVEWLEPPAFPGFRAERLPGQPERADVLRDGVAWIARVEERALFAERPGELVIAPKGLRCRLASGAQLTASVAPTRVRVLALPADGRPPGFSGVVGSFQLEATLQPRALALGESARVELTLSGDANLWDARDPLAGAGKSAGAEWFAAPPRLELDPGVELGVRRRFAWDVVPTREGRIELPELRVPYFDPVKRRYAVASAPALALAVGPRPAAPAAQHARPAEAPDPNASARRRAFGALALAALAAGAALAWRHRWRAPDAGVRSAALAALTAPKSADPAAALARALRLALAPELPRARHAPVEELCAPPGASAAWRHALALLAQVERARFDPHAPRLQPDQVLAAIEALERR